ncbi:MAG: Cytochrome-c peroxidase [Gemmatimonadetes bacterium]|nr:Cytochrome-c peroxidase [Gemmatimonadota bacterium]
MRVVLTALIGAAALLGACKPAEKPAAAPESAQQELMTPAQLAMFAPLPEAMPSPDNPMTPAKVDLGRRLYYETLLSEDHQMSCNSVYNAAAHVAQFWDGRAPTVEEQAKGPILNPVEMAMPNSKEVLKHLRADPTYVRMFKAAFPGQANPVTYDNLGRAIGAFERGLVTPARWDSFLKGDRTALTTEEQIGLKAFVTTGCAACHNGPYMGGTAFQKAGVVQPWPDQADKGREAVTGFKADEMMFKVASLRNIEKTGPYFHDGAVADLAEAVNWMGKYQLGRDLKPDEVKAIVAYLKTLTGTIPTEYIAPPARPN